MDTVIMIAMPIIFLGLLLTEYFLIKRCYDSGIKELKMKYEDIVEATRKETERKMRELSLKESIKIERTIIDTKKYEQSIIIEDADIRSFQDPDDFQKFIRSNFADRFAKDVIAPNLVINEVNDIMSHKKKYFTRIHVGF